MTDRIKEQLSTFLDGELPEPETALLLKRLDRDDDLRGALSRYSLIGAVLRELKPLLRGAVDAAPVDQRRAEREAQARLLTALAGGTGK